MAMMSTTALPKRRANARRYAPLSHGIVMNLRVLVALILRDAGMRAGGGLISYLWTMIEPAILVGFMLFMRTYIKDIAPAIGDSSVLFLLTGFLTFRMVRGTTGKASKAVMAYRAMFDMGVIKPPDVVIARTVVEFTNWLIVVVVFFAGVREILGHEVIADLAGFVLILLAIFYFCLSLSMLNAVLFAILPVWQTIWKLLTLPLLFVSGVIYVPSTMPPEIQAIIYWNPVLHCIEGMRSVSYLDYTSLYNGAYLISLSTAILLVALILERIYRREIIRSDIRFDDEDDLF